VTCIAVHTAVFARCQWKRKDGYLVEGSNAGFHNGGGDKVAASLSIPGLTIAQVDRSVKVRRNSRRVVSRF